MPKFIDGHRLKDLTPEKLEKLANSPPDKHGITHIELFYNEKEDKLYCVLEGPNEESIWKHHEDAGLKCEFITEVKQVKTDMMIKTEKMQTLGEMSSRAFHDLRNPLSIIKNSLEIINIKWKDTMPPEMNGYLSKMDRAASFINTMIDDVVNYARTRPLMLERNSLLQVINGALESAHIPNNIRIKIPAEDVFFEFDSAKVEVLFTNLFTNSIHAIGDKMGEISISIEEKEDKILIRVQDSGPGVPKELLPRIFEPLFTTKVHGTGLGLPSCKDIVEKHHGTIDITNDPTTVTLIIPKHQDVFAKIGRE